MTCLLALGLASGCFQPDVKNGGFACSTADDPACPQGFFCVGGLCQDHPGQAGGEVDMATGTGGNGGGGGGGGGDLASLSMDMAHAPADLAQVPDMATPACGMSLADCSATPCCSGHICLFKICF